MSKSDWIALFSLIISSSIAFVSLIVSGITAFYAYKVYQATQEQLELATSSAKSAEKIANEQLELAKQDANNSAEAAKQQKFVSCIEMYAKIYAEKALFFEEFIERCTDKDFNKDFSKYSKYISNIKDKQARDKCYEEIHNDTYILNNIQQQQQTIASWSANKFICETQPFIDAVLILEQQLNDDERKKFYAMVKIYSSNFIELFEMVNSLENYTPANQTAFDNTQRVFNALQNKKQ